ncbi:MAG: S1 RNA-binding domain-containing protein [Planctomycetota bacterium]
MPEIPEGPMQRPALAIDADKLARSWQVGRSKLLSVSRALQFPFADGRDFQYPVPLRSYVPSMDRLEPGTMLSALVIGIANFGVFVELGPDCTGLVHVSQLGHAFVEDAHQFVQVGDVVPVWVLHTDESKKRVALTMRRPGSEQESSARQSSNDRPAGENRNRQERTDRPDRRGSSGSSRPTGNNANDQSRGPRPGGRPNDRRSGSSGDSRGPNRGRQQDQGRKPQYNRDASDNNDSRSQRPVKISRPVPEKPISEAMQQGKEPLRSFGDLMQFLKKTTGPEETPKPNPAPSDPPIDVPGTQAPSDTPAPGDDDVGV